MSRLITPILDPLQGELSFTRGTPWDIHDLIQILIRNCKIDGIWVEKVIIGQNEIQNCLIRVQCRMSTVSLLSLRCNTTEYVTRFKISELVPILSQSLMVSERIVFGHIRNISNTELILYSLSNTGTSKPNTLNAMHKHIGGYLKQGFVILEN